MVKLSCALMFTTSFDDIRSHEMHDRWILRLAYNFVHCLLTTSIDTDLSCRYESDCETIRSHDASQHSCVFHHHYCNRRAPSTYTRREAGKKVPMLFFSLWCLIDYFWTTTQIGQYILISYVQRERHVNIFSRRRNVKMTSEKVAKEKFWN